MNKNKLIEILDKLSSLQYSDKIMIFGSVSAGKEEPGDVDLFIDLSDESVNDISIRFKYNSLLSVSRKFYGELDPFLIFRDGLLVRNDDATGWNHAKKAKSIRAEMLKDGTPLLDIARNLSKKMESRHSIDSLISPL